jgi:3-hydroxybutyryl-CoA dehydrogenase
MTDVDGQIKVPVLIAGDSKIANTIAICLLLAKHPVTIYTSHVSATWEQIQTHLDDVKNNWNVRPETHLLAIRNKLEPSNDYLIAIGVTSEILMEKTALIQKLENILGSEVTIAINTESFSLKDLQHFCRHPQRLIGVNWVEPAHTTYFLEIIANSVTDKKLVEGFYTMAKKYWNKDPYVINSGNGVRARLMCALIREAFYLVENGYVCFEDIDRACRNDAGYYLPFAGNFQYMDLMGTYIYGIVMKDLNPELAIASKVPYFFSQMLQEGCEGMENNHGFYEYTDVEVKRWSELSRKFSYEIKEIIDRYGRSGSTNF